MKNFYNSFKRIGLIILLVLTCFCAIAKEEVVHVETSAVDVIFVFVISSLVFILLVLIYLLYALNIFIKNAHPENLKESFWAKLITKLTDTVPLEKEEMILTDHIYDGIQELDNNLPPWWKYMFYATIVFSGVYIYYYHFSTNGQLQIQEYEQEMVVAALETEAFMKLAANSIDETNTKLSDAKGIEKGKTVFIQSCAACHGKEGEGGVGPNLTDEFWIHGGGLKDVFKTIKYGVPQKGMISWKAQLSPSSIQDVASYIKSIAGTKPVNSKAPQGEKYQEKKEVAVK